MPHHNRARLADLGIQNLDPKKEYKHVGKNGMFVKKENASTKKLEEQKKTNFLENKEGDELFLITVTCPSDNVDPVKTEEECAKHNCETIVAVKDDSHCGIVKVEPFQK